MKDVMVDCETLAVTADAVIMSIGATEFELEGRRLGRTFYQSISIDSNLNHKRRIEESTLIWWMDQSIDARKVFSEPKVTLEGGLFELAQWMSPIGDDARIWSNGASFDIPMLEHAFKQCLLDQPWSFYNARCMRTYKTLPGVEKLAKPVPAVAHNALDDAIAQAKYVQIIHAALFGREVAKDHA